MTENSRPVLAAKARLRFDPVSKGYLLLSPERGLVLNATASALVRLCTGDHTVTGLIARLTEPYPDCPPRVIAEDVLDFLNSLERRGLLRESAA